MYYIEIIKEDLLTFAEDFGKTKKEVITNVLNDINNYYHCNCRNLTDLKNQFENIVDVEIRKID